MPREIDILRYYVHFEKIVENQKVSVTMNQIQGLYTRAGIPTIHAESIRSKIKRLVASMKSVVETRKSKKSNQIEKETSLFQKIDQLFEVTQNEEILSVIQKNFLADQRSIRQMFVSDLNVDSINLPNIFNPSQSSTSQTYSASNEPEKVSDSDDDSVEPVDYDTSPDFVPFFDIEERARKRIQLCDADLTELSKCGGSYRVIEKALTIGIKAAGGSPKDFAISKTSLWGQIDSLRTLAKSTNLEEIASSDEKVILHFDGKKFAKINAKHVGKDSRMVAVCHTRTKNVALGMPILESGQAQAYVNELIGLCENYNLTNRVVGLVCDTTAVNTGERGGVFVIFENETETEVLNITCRHHIHELNLSAAMRTALGEIDAPTITIFDSVKREWPRIKDGGYQYQPCDELVLNSPHLRTLYIDAKTTLLEHAKIKHIRDDYAEMTDLCLKFFGIKTKKGFMVPGSISKARWMAKAIYGMKMYLFRREIDLDETFEMDLLEFALFVSIIHCKHWNRCTKSFDSPVNDLALLAELQKYSEYNEMIANSVLGSFLNHLWYLGGELVVLAIFSDGVQIAEKNRMRIKLTSRRYPARTENSLRLKHYDIGTQLNDLVTERSQFLFSILDINLSFLKERAETWENNTSYKKAKKLIGDLVVVNDTAERALGRANNIIKNQKARSEARVQNMFLSLYS